MSDDITGNCLCGQITYTIAGPLSEFHICHCSQCRRSTGSAHASNIFTQADRIKWTSGKDLVKHFDAGKPGALSKSFCSHCGSLVPYISTKSGKLVIPAGGLSDGPAIAPQDNIFWRDRAQWYDSVLKAPRYDGFPTTGK